MTTGDAGAETQSDADVSTFDAVSTGSARKAQASVSASADVRASLDDGDAVVGTKDRRPGVRSPRRALPARAHHLHGQDVCEPISVASSPSFIAVLGDGKPWVSGPFGLPSVRGLYASSSPPSTGFRGVPNSIVNRVDNNNTCVYTTLPTITA